ncbi:hypothetical protein KUTeg_010742 [Tegillarca granosa]|uniref:VDE lipocalin domain-containing protein n=1 Tax=Tegillarca granosa TaxID=220873 RepID=A0ABQ9F523_TEGGR|nr:hypothetical protein KUTeg_010742 [Tegillarca granosa]
MRRIKPDLPAKRNLGTSSWVRIRSTIALIVRSPAIIQFPVLSIYTLYRANEKFDVRAINGGIVHREVNETVEQTDPDKGGLLNYTSSQIGQKASSEWRILDYAVNGNYILAYYCGRVTENWFFEGSVVYSRAPTLSNEDLQTLQATGTKLGIDFNTYCKPKTSGCI